MLSDLSEMAQNLIALVIGGLLASILAALFLLIYRLFVGRGRPFVRDAMGTAAVAFFSGGAVAIAGAVLTYLHGFGLAGIDGIVAAVVALLMVLAGFRYGRRVAGYHNIRSASSDAIPFLAAAVLGVGCVFLLALLEQFS
jgi:hypothetical protein